MAETFPESVIHRCSVKKVLSPMFSGHRPAALLKEEALAQVFSCEFCGISKNAFSHRTPLVTACEFLTD